MLEDIKMKDDPQDVAPGSAAGDVRRVRIEVGDVPLGVGTIFPGGIRITKPMPLSVKNKFYIRIKSMERSAMDERGTVRQKVPLSSIWEPKEKIKIREQRAGQSENVANGCDNRRSVEKLMHAVPMRCSVPNEFQNVKIETEAEATTNETEGNADKYKVAPMNGMNKYVLDGSHAKIKMEKTNTEDEDDYDGSYQPFEGVSVKQECYSDEEGSAHFCRVPPETPVKRETSPEQINPGMFVSVNISEGCTEVQTGRTHDEGEEGEKKIFECDMCGRVFSARPHLVIHIRSVHNHEKPFKCAICGTAFAHRSTLTVHVRGHTGEKPFSCEACGRKFTKKGNLNLHLQVHSGVKPYVCSTCSKAFARPNNLMEHMRVHTGERAHVCAMCEKSFSSQSVLNRHKRLHKKKETFKCERCDKAFARVSYLSEHQRVHTGERPYVCQQCGESFMHRGQVFRHRQLHKHRGAVVPLLLKPDINPGLVVGVPADATENLCS